MLLARMVPFTLFAPLAGAFVDRWSRRMVMIVSDLARVPLLSASCWCAVRNIFGFAYVCTALLSVFGSFFEAAKNAAMPNITGERDLLAGNALMFSSRFLLMSLGAALGGWTAANVGYRAAFIVNAVSFLGSAFSVWLIPEARNEGTGAGSRSSRSWKQRRLLVGYSRRLVVHRQPCARSQRFLRINILWASGGGAINLIMDRLGGIVFAGQRGISGDSAVAALYFAGGLGLFIGMMIARRVGHHFELLGKTPAFIGWGLLLRDFCLR